MIIAQIAVVQMMLLVRSKGQRGYFRCSRQAPMGFEEGPVVSRLCNCNDFLGGGSATYSCRTSGMPHCHICYADLELDSVRKSFMHSEAR